MKDLFKADLESRLESSSLLIFARYPRLGEVKTRLEAELEAQQCLLLYEAMLADSLERYSLPACKARLYLHGCSLSEGKDLFFRLRTRVNPELSVALQVGEDLGRRMWNAYEGASLHSDRVVLVGSDSPSVPLKFIRHAFDILRKVPVVIGPADDGGYYLIGLAEPREELFLGIPWGTSSVLSATEAKLCRPNYELLPTWYDIDQKKDLERLARDLAHPFEGYPKRTAAYLRKIGLLHFSPPEERSGQKGGLETDRSPEEHGRT